MDKQATLKWLNEMCQEAFIEARRGNSLPANKMGGNPALAHYLNNVAGTGNIKPDDWAHWYKDTYLVEADNLRVASEQAAEQTTHGKRLDTLEAKLDKMAGMVEALVEAQQQPALEEADVEPEAEPEAEDEAPADDLAEADAAGDDDEPDDETESDEEVD